MPRYLETNEHVRCNPRKGSYREATKLSSTVAATSFFSINFAFGALLVFLLLMQTINAKDGNDECMAKDTVGVWERCLDQIMFVATIHLSPDVIV